MNPKSPTFPARRSRFVAQIAGAAAFGLGAVALIGWWLNLSALKCIVPGSTPLKPNIATGFILCGATLILLSRGKVTNSIRICTTAMGGIVIALGALTLAEYFSNWNLGIDHWLVRDFPASMGALNPGRMMPTTAFCFILTGIALFPEAQLIAPRLRFPLVAGLSAFLVLIGILGLGGYFLEGSFGPQWNLLGMTISGVSAVVGFMLLGSGLLALLQGQGGLKWSLDNFTTAGFAVGLLLTVLTTASAFTFANQMLETNKWVNHRQEVLKKSQEVMTDTVDLASRERVYIITGNEQLLKEREQLRTKTREDFSSVRKLTSDNPNQQRNLDQLEPLIAQQIDWEEQMIALRREEGFAPTAQLVATGPGLKLSNDIVLLLTEIQNEEYALLGADQKRAAAASTATFLLLPLGMFLSLTVLSLGIFFMNAGVAERVQVEETLRKSEERYRELFESNPNPMWVYDLETLSFLAVNTAAVRHYGYSQDEFLAMTLKDIRPSEDIPALMDDLSQTTDGLDNSTQWRHRKKDGALIDVEITSHELIWLGRRSKLVLINDITERKRAEATRAELAAIVQSSDDAIIGKDLNGVITSWNRGAERIFGYTSEESVGQSIMRLIPPDRQTEEAEILTRIRRGQRAEHFETVRVGKGGRRLDLSITVSPILDPTGKVTGASKVARDISERKKAEQEIRQLNIELEERVVRRTAELEAANKELEAFSYSVSHDLRAPLRAVDGFSQAVLEDYGSQLPEEGRHYLQTVRDGAQRMGVLIDDLLTFSRLSRLPLHKQPIDTERVVREALEELAPQKEDRQVDLCIGDLPSCEGDPALLKQVWVNLLSNALKYTRKQPAPRVEVGSRREADHYVYFVCDNGTGFDMQYAHKLFGVFQRLHRADEFEGTGVGLAIVQRVIQRHGGRIWAEAAPDRGASFYFTVGNGANS